MSTYSIKRAVSLIEIIIASENPWGIMLRGPHGIGKSEVVKQIAKKVDKKLIDTRLSQKSEGDLVGLPKEKSEKYTDFLPPYWFYTACQEPCVLFLDEADRAIIEVRQGAFEIGDSRSLNGATLHPETLVFSACNNGMHGQASNYDVNDLDPAELDRWTVIDLEPTLDDWLQYAISIGVEDCIIDFHNDVSREQTHLEHEGQFEPNKVYPSRRSWIRFNEVIQSYMKQKELTNMGEISDSIMMGLLDIHIGEEGAAAFIDYWRKYKHEKIVTLDDIFVNGSFRYLKKFELTDYNALAEKFVHKKYYEKIGHNDDYIDNFIIFLRDYCPQEIAPIIFKALPRVPIEQEEELLNKMRTSGRKVFDKKPTQGQITCWYYRLFSRPFKDKDGKNKDLATFIRERVPNLESEEIE